MPDPMPSSPEMGTPGAESYQLNRPYGGLESPGPTWAEANPLEAARRIAEMGAQGHAELSPTVNVPQELGISEKEKPNFIVDWRKAIIKGWGPDVIKQQIERMEREIGIGRSAGMKEKIKVDRGGIRAVAELSPTEYLQELLLAQAVYQTPQEAAITLRDHEGLVRKEIDRFQLQEASSRGEFVTRKDGTKIQRTEYYRLLESTQQFIERPLEITVFEQTIKILEGEYGPEYVRRMAARIRAHEIVGLMPSIQDLPLRVPLEAAQRELKQYSRPTALTEEQVLALQQMGREEQRKAMEKMGQTLGGVELGGGMSGEYYIGMYQQAWDEFNAALYKLPSEKQNEVIANYIVGGGILGGQYPKFYQAAVEQAGRAPSRWSPWLEAGALVAKLKGMEGYIPPEHLFQAIGSVKPEVLAFPDYLKSRHEMWLGGENKPREFTLETRHIIGEVGRLENLAALCVNDAYKDKTGYFALRNGILAEYCFRQMGFSRDQAHKMAFGEAESPVLVRDNFLSPVRREELTNMGDWIGETALPGMVVALQWLKWARVNEEWVPLDLKRRSILSMRGLEIAGYRIGYSLGLPPEQFLSMISLFGSAVSIDHKEMLGWVRERFGKETALAETRQKIWDKTITLTHPSLAGTRRLARMALGLGSYKATGDEYRKRLEKGLKKMPSSRVPALRHPDLWKYRWFENCDEDQSRWRYVGDQTEGVNQRDAMSAFDGYDFTEELRACGLSERELGGIPRVGFDGWKSLLQHATLGLLEWRAMGYTTGDKATRYLKKVEGAQDTAIAFLETSSRVIPRALRDAEAPSPEGGLYGDVGEDSASLTTREERFGHTTEKEMARIEADAIGKDFEEKLKKMVEPLSRTPTFVTNGMQAAWVEAILTMYMDGHLACSLDTLVEDVDIERLEGGDNWTVNLIRRKDVTNKSRLEALYGSGCFFVHNPDKIGNDDDVLVSPLGAPMPKLVPASEVLDKIGTRAEKMVKEGHDVERYVFLQKAVALMKGRGAFCWDTLINARTDIPPMAIINSMLSLGEEGILNAATAEAIRAELLRYVAKIYPKHLRRIGGADQADEPLLS